MIQLLWCNITLKIMRKKKMSIGQQHNLFKSFSLCLRPEKLLLLEQKSYFLRLLVTATVIHADIPGMQEKIIHLVSQWTPGAGGGGEGPSFAEGLSPPCLKLWGLNRYKRNAMNAHIIMTYIMLNPSVPPSVLWGPGSSCRHWLSVQ